MSFALPTSSKLKSRSDINQLFERHSTSNASPLRCLYSECEGESQILVSVPKRMFRRAVKRNLLKRKIREAYRLHRGCFGDKHYRMAFIYTTPKECNYEEIESSVLKIFEKITSRK